MTCWAPTLSAPGSGPRPQHARRGRWTGLEGKVRLSFGEADASVYCWQSTGDLAVHAWDLAMGIGAPQPIDEELAEELLRVAAPMIEALPTSDILAPPVSVPATASAVDRCVALFGREPR